jgi:hypothetical protein
MGEPEERWSKGHSLRFPIGGEIPGLEEEVDAVGQPQGFHADPVG